MERAGTACFWKIMICQDRFPDLEMMESIEYGQLKCLQPSFMEWKELPIFIRGKNWG